MDGTDDHHARGGRIDVEEQLFAADLDVGALARAQLFRQFGMERIAREVGRLHQALLAIRRVGHDNHRPPRGAFGIQFFQRGKLHPTFSTNTRILPPQESPTFQAVSSATPNSSIFGLPSSMTSSASVTTAPSTQPPETEPRKLPSASITRLEPTGRGAEPQVSTTVASATPRPALRQSSAALRMSSSRASMRGLLSLGCPEYRDSKKRKPV